MIFTRNSSYCCSAS